jgi:hypothetical protein
MSDRYRSGYVSTALGLSLCFSAAETEQVNDYGAAWPGCNRP